MPARRLPVRPDLEQLRHQARDLLRAIRAGEPEALADLREFHPESIDPASVQLADAQLVLARSYEASSWPRLKQACDLIDAIWRDDIEAVRALVTAHPYLLHENAGIRNNNWGPPMSYAANLGRDQIIRMLHSMGARDLEKAAGRAALQSQVTTARMIHELAGSPPVGDHSLGGPAYTLSASGTALMLSLGARPHNGDGCPAAVVLETDSRDPAAKHTILEAYAAHGLDLPDTPTVAVHRGRIDLLEEHLARDPALLSRTFSHREIYPAELGCREPIDATVGTPLGGSTLLHLAVEYDEMDIARWLLARGMDVNARSRIGASGFGGHTALFNTVVSQPNFWMNYKKRGSGSTPFTELLLEHGAGLNIRGSLWKQLHPGHGDITRHEYRDVTALSWGRKFHAPIFVNLPAMKLIEEAGGSD